MCLNLRQIQICYMQRSPTPHEKASETFSFPGNVLEFPSNRNRCKIINHFFFLLSTTASNPSHPSLTFSASRLVALNILTILFIFRSHIPSRHWCSHYSEHSGQHGEQIYFMSLRFIRILICCSKS